MMLGSSSKKEVAAVLAHGLLDTTFAKTTHGLVRGPSRFEIAGIVDPEQAGKDAGELLDGSHRGLPVFASISDLVAGVPTPPDHCVIGIANPGGSLPLELRGSLLEAATAGWTLVNGLHHLLAEDTEIAQAVIEGGGRIIDIRQPRPVAELRFWSGEIFSLEVPRIAILGVDCAVGKRTTAALLQQACNASGLQTEMVYTGQTGWLQGFAHGFVLDATPNDFVCGELEGEILRCARETEPDLILIEGQSGLRNPSGPCGSELLLAGGASGVILQHAPKREFYEEFEAVGCRIPPLAEEVELIRLLGSEVWAITLHQGGMHEKESLRVKQELARELGIPVLLPLAGDLPELAQIVRQRLQGDPSS